MTYLILLGSWRFFLGECSFSTHQVINPSTKYIYIYRTETMGYAKASPIGIESTLAYLIAGLI